MAILSEQEYAAVHKVRYPEDSSLDTARAYQRYKKISEETQQSYELPDPENVLPSRY